MGEPERVVGWTGEWGLGWWVGRKVGKQRAGGKKGKWVLVASKGPKALKKDSYLNRKKVGCYA